MVEKKLSYFEVTKKFKNDNHIDFPPLGARRQEINNDYMFSEMTDLRFMVESLQKSVTSLNKIIEEKDRTIINLTKKTCNLKKN